MTLEECYQQLNGDLASARSRLMSERLVDKFIRKYPDDTTFQQLKEAVAQLDRKAAFSAAHTLKGVAANLSFTDLQKSASELTEQLRDGSADPDKNLFQAVEEAQNRVIAVLQAYMA